MKKATLVLLTNVQDVTLEYQPILTELKLISQRVNRNTPAFLWLPHLHAPLSSNPYPFALPNICENRWIILHVMKFDRF